MTRFALFRIVSFAAVAAIAGIGLSGEPAWTLSPHAVISTAAAAETAGAEFAPIAVVLRHPRCMNCHPRDDRPRQGDDEHLHLQNIVRGPDNMGFVNARCNACHRDENNAHTGVPGAPNWTLAPLSMGWTGLNDADLCSALKDETKNGGKTIAELVRHMSHDKLVLWGWTPGGTRTPVSTPHADFVKQLKAWEAAGAPCPAS
jgi:hypothetical protein